MEQAVSRIFAAYGRAATRMLPPQKGYRNTSYGARLTNGSMANLIIYKAEAGTAGLIGRVNAVSGYLADSGLPVRRPLDSRILCLNTSSQATKRYASLYNYLPGQTIPWEAYTMDHIKLLGMALSTVHHSLADFPISNLPDCRLHYMRQIGRMLNYFEDTGVGQAMPCTLRLAPPLASCRALLDLLELCAALPASQALHMDFVRGNILFEPAGLQAGAEPVTKPLQSGLAVGMVKVSGILDFEKVSRGHPLFDIARTLAFLLVDCKYKTAGQVRKYFLNSGYAKRGWAALPLVRIQTSGGQVDLLEQLIDLFLLYDFYKFLRHNPYEALKVNEHYQRTSQLLLDRGLIHSAH